jgi:AcrR family transcriptional regulator
MMQKSEASEDLRIRRTRKLLQQAFIELTVERGFAALTVQDITERAMVNRSTFYRYYLDKHDLLAQYIDGMYEMVEGSPALTEKGEPLSLEVPASTLNLLKHIQQFADFYRVMLGPKGDPRFTQHFRQNIEKCFLSCLPPTLPAPAPDAPPIDLRLNFIAYAGVGTIVWWLKQEHPCPPEQLARWLLQLRRPIADPSLTLNSNRATWE